MGGKCVISLLMWMTCSFYNTRISNLSRKISHVGGPFLYGNLDD